MNLSLLNSGVLIILYIRGCNSTEPWIGSLMRISIAQLECHNYDIHFVVVIKKCVSWSLLLVHYLLKLSHSYDKSVYSTITLWTHYSVTIDLSSTWVWSCTCLQDGNLSLKWLYRHATSTYSYLEMIVFTRRSKNIHCPRFHQWVYSISYIDTWIDFYCTD